MKKLRPVGARDDPGADQAAQRIAARRMLDLDHVDAPIRQHRAGARNEEPLGDLDQAHTVEHLEHGRNLHAEKLCGCHTPCATGSQARASAVRPARVVSCHVRPP